MPNIAKAHPDHPAQSQTRPFFDSVWICQCTPPAWRHELLSLQPSCTASGRRIPAEEPVMPS